MWAVAVDLVSPTVIANRRANVKYERITAMSSRGTPQYSDHCQMMIALNPFVQAIFNTTDFQKFALIIEQDNNIERLIQLIEESDRENQFDSSSS